MNYLDVPYDQKDDAKAMGARWDAGCKKWYVPKGVLATPFELWMLNGAAEKMIRAAGKPTKDAKPLKAPKGAARRADDASGVVVIGEHYKAVQGATGLPWAV